MKLLSGQLVAFLGIHFKPLISELFVLNPACQEYIYIKVPN